MNITHKFIWKSINMKNRKQSKRSNTWKEK